MSVTARRGPRCVTCGVLLATGRLMCSGCLDETEAHVGEPRTEWGRGRKVERDARSEESP